MINIAGAFAPVPARRSGLPVPGPGGSRLAPAPPVERHADDPAEPSRVFARMGLDAHTQIPSGVLDPLVGVVPIDVPIVLPGQDPPPEGGFLQPRRHSPGRPAVYYFHQRPTRFQVELLGIEDKVIRRSTGHRVGEEAPAVRMAILFIENERNRLLGRVLPTQVSIGTMLRCYFDYLVDGHHHLSPNTVDAYLNYLEPLNEFWGGKRLGMVDEETCIRYAKWRCAQPVALGGRDTGRTGPRRVSLGQARGELSLLRNIVRRFGRSAGNKLDFEMPRWRIPRREVVWLRRSQLARFLWALRGRVWNAEAGRWRILRDDDPSLAGPKGDRRFLRPRVTREFRAALARMTMVGVYTGTRHSAIMAIRHDNVTGANIDWTRGTLERRGMAETETWKRRPAVLLVPKLARLIRGWQARDAERGGVTHLVHTRKGKPYAHPIGPQHWTPVTEDAGLDVHVTPHVFRHTCAMYLKAEGVSLWVAAEFLGCTTTVLELIYGTWDVSTQHDAVAALQGMSAQRRVAGRLRRG